MSTPFAPQIDGSATERIGGDQSWPLQAGPTTHLPPQDANAAPQFVQPQFVQPQFAQPQFAQPQFAQPQFAQPQYGQPQSYRPAPYQPAPYHGGPQQSGPQYVDHQYIDDQYIDQQYAAPAAYGTSPQQGQVWQVDEETERFVDGPAAFVPPPAAVAEHTARRRRSAWISVLTGLVVASAVLISGYFVIGSLSEAPASAVAGDCLARSGAGAVVVPCSDQQATFIVLGRLDSRTQVEASMSACTSFTGTTDVYWQGKEGADARGLVLCLGPAKK